MPWLPSGPTSIDFKPTDNPKTLEKLQNDPLMLRQPRVDMGYGLVEADGRGAATRPKRVHLPYLMLHGHGRPAGADSDRCARRIEIMPPRADSKLAFYKHGYHLLMRDKEGPVVAADIAAWIANHEAALPSGADAAHSQPELAALWGTKR